MATPKYLLVVLILMVCLLSACAPTSRVVLLDGMKSNTAVVVTTEKGELILDKPNTYTVLSSADKKPAAAQKINTKELEKRYGKLINSAPKPPISFLLYFETGTTLDQKSQHLFSDIKRAIQERAPCDVNIIGHADRSGSKKYNIQLSLQRAQWVWNWLKRSNLKIENVIVESYGEEDPLIPTADGVAEPRNRRVEVLVR